MTCIFIIPHLFSIIHFMIKIHKNWQISSVIKTGKSNLSQHYGFTQSLIHILNHISLHGRKNCYATRPHSLKALNKLRIIKRRMRITLFLCSHEWKWRIHFFTIGFGRQSSLGNQWPSILDSEFTKNVHFSKSLINGIILI